MLIRQLFEKAKAENRKLFIPYITCGDPDLSATKSLVKELAQIGADIIELGIPFSDPLADGTTNQLAAMRALKNHVNVAKCCDLVKTLRTEGCTIPIVFFTYFNPIYKLGIEAFTKLAQTSGVNAVLIVDLPIEEASDILNTLQQYGIGMILLISPTTTPERVQLSSDANPEFLYYVSRTGVTGQQQTLSATLEQELIKIRQLTKLPIAVGFGISTPAHAAEVANYADGVIVGSALVKLLENHPFLDAKENLLTLASSINAAIKKVSSQ